MITNKDIRVENGFLIINGDNFPLDGQSPETIMEIVEDNSDTTPTENSTAPVTSGGVYTADKAISDTIGDITQTGITGADVASQLKEVNDVITGAIGNLKFALFTQTFSDVDINTAWGSLYNSAIQKIDISTLGLITPPKAVFLALNESTSGLFIMNGGATATAVSFNLVRAVSQTDVTAKISALVLY